MDLTSPIATIVIDTKFLLVQDDEEMWPSISVRLRYRPHDPYAVNVVFLPAFHNPKSWCFARDLLKDSLTMRAGSCDVRAWPWKVEQGDFIALAFSSPDGSCRFAARRSVITRFLRRSYTAVPEGDESKHIDVDSCIQRLLTN